MSFFSYNRYSVLSLPVEQTSHSPKSRKGKPKPVSASSPISEASPQQPARSWLSEEEFPRLQRSSASPGILDPSTGNVNVNVPGVTIRPVSKPSNSQTSVTSQLQPSPNPLTKPKLLPKTSLNPNPSAKPKPTTKATPKLVLTTSSNSHKPTKANPLPNPIPSINTKPSAKTKHSPIPPTNTKPSPNPKTKPELFKRSTDSTSSGSCMESVDDESNCASSEASVVSIGDIVEETALDLTQYDHLSNPHKVRQMRKDLGLYKQIEYVDCDPTKNTLTAWYNQKINVSSTNAQYIVNKVSQLHYYVQNALGALVCGPNTELIVQHLDLMKKWYCQLKQTSMDSVSLNNEYKCTISYLEWYQSHYHTASANTNIDILIANALRAIKDMKSGNQKRTPSDVNVETTKTATTKCSGETAETAGSMIFLDQEVNKAISEIESLFDLSNTGTAVNTDQDRHIWFSRYLITALVMSYGSRSGTLTHHEFRHAIPVDIERFTLWQIVLHSHNAETKEPITLLLGSRLYKLLKIYDRYFRHSGVKDKNRDSFFRKFHSAEAYANISSQVSQFQKCNKLPLCTATQNKQNVHVSAFLALGGNPESHTIICEVLKHSEQTTQSHYTPGLAVYRRATLQSIKRLMGSKLDLDTDTAGHFLYMHDVVSKDIAYIKRSHTSLWSHQSSLLEGLTSENVQLLCDYLMKAVSDRGSNSLEGIMQSRSNSSEAGCLEQSLGPSCPTSPASHCTVPTPFTNSTAANPSTSPVKISPKQFAERWRAEFTFDHYSQVPRYKEIVNQGVQWGYPLSVIQPADSSFQKNVTNYLREHLVKVQAAHIIPSIRKRPQSSELLVELIQKQLPSSSNMKKLSAAVLAGWKTPPKRHQLKCPAFLSISVTHYDQLLRKAQLQDWEGVEIKENLPDRGRGLFAIKAFQQNEVVCDYHGETLAGSKLVEDYKSNYSNDLSYFFEFKFNDCKHANNAIDVQYKNTFGRNANHSSCCPNVQPQVIKLDTFPRIYFTAIHYIKPGDEILWDYGDKVARDMFKDTCPSCLFKKDPKYMSSTYRMRISFEDSPSSAQSSPHQSSSSATKPITVTSPVVPSIAETITESTPAASASTDTISSSPCQTSLHKRRKRKRSLSQDNQSK